MKELPTEPIFLAYMISGYCLALPSLNSLVHYNDLLAD